MKTARDVAKDIVDCSFCRILGNRSADGLIMLITQALTAFAEERLAQRDLEQFGEAFMLNGKRIAPNEFHKSTADYVKEARAEALEQAFAEAANHCVAHRDYEHGTDEMIACELPKRILALKGTP